MWVGDGPRAFAFVLRHDQERGETRLGGAKYEGGKEGSNVDLSSFFTTVLKSEGVIPKHYASSVRFGPTADAWTQCV